MPMVTAPVKRSRSFRQVEAFATDNGSKPLKMRGIEAFAPGAAAKKVPSDAAVSFALHPDVLAWIDSNRKARAAGESSSMAATKGVLRAAAVIASMNVTSSVRRITVSGGDGVERRLSAVAYAAIHRHVVGDAAARPLVVVVENDAVAEHTGRYLETTFALHAIVLDTATKLIPSIAPASPKKQSTAAIDVVVLSAAVADPSRKTAMALSKLAAQCSGVVVLVQGDKDSAASAAAARATLGFFGSLPVAILGESLEDITASRLAAAVSNIHSSTAAPSSSRAGTAAAVDPVQVHATTVQGLMKFQTLYGLIVAQASTSVASTGGATIVTVHFSTPQVASFWCDVLIAMRELPPSVAIICDSEDITEAKRSSSGDSQANALAQVAAAIARGCRCIVLLSAFEIVCPATIEKCEKKIFVQYDALLRIPDFAGFVRQQLVPAGYQHIMMLLRPNEEKNALLLLNSCGRPHAVTFTSTAAPSATIALLSAQKLKGLHKKMFVIHQKAFEAFRAAMQVYSRLHPREVYDVKDVDLNAYAAEFGYEEAPLLDLRTKQTVFRPREDLVKQSMKRLVSERRAKRKFAEENLVGEGPEEHSVPEQFE